jgi:ribonuclease J
MEQNLRVARDLGHLSFDWERLVSLDQANRLPPNKVVLLITGSQGEPSAVMSRIAVGDHRQIEIQPADLVIFSATAVPGNENTVARTIDNLMRRGANVLYPPVTQGIHVSGHACSDELRLMIDTLRPTFCVPVHGEYRQMVLYSNLAVESGIPAENVVLSDIGEVIAFGDGGWDKSTRVDAGRVFIEGRTIGDVTGGILRDRRHLAEDGVVVAALAIDRETSELLGGPDLVSRGFRYPSGGPFLTAAAESIRITLERDYDGRGDREYFAKRIRDLLRRYIYNEIRRRPLIVPVVTEV